MCALILVGAFVLFVVLPWLVWKGPFEIDKDHLDEAKVKEQSGALVTGLRTAVVAFTAALGAGIALLYTARNYRLTRRGQITDRFTKALERLGSPEIYIRIGGILALEQIVRDAPEQAATDAARVLGHFIRHHAPSSTPPPPSSTPYALPPDPLPDTPAGDVQAALTALTRPKSRAHVDPSEPLDLHGLHLAGANLNSADLTRANLSRANLTNANLSGATFTGVDLRGATFTDVDLYRATLTGVDLNGATLTDVDLHRATLTGVDLNGATLTGVNLNDATLTEVHLSRATLTDVRLNGATLTGVHLSRATLTEVFLSRATLTGVDLNEATLTSVHLNGATLTDVDLNEATLTRVGLNGATLTDVDLNEATLTRVDLHRATLTDVHLNEATLTNIHLTGADVSGAVGLLLSQLASVRTDGKTELPEWFYPRTGKASEPEA
ncbi:pentapeptide repeat-containing protein [Streptomyces sp. NPDC090106]|uniref:pentapeptide repeat-containing protein n=1 Tax=Streptomyces sp. NPDC090106 TaxID=3365946 RepID=UPI0038150EE5